MYLPTKFFQIMENYQGGTKRHPSLVWYIFRIRNWQKCKDNLKEVVDFEATAEERDQPAGLLGNLVKKVFQSSKCSLLGRKSKSQFL